MESRTPPVSPTPSFDFVVMGEADCTGGLSVDDVSSSLLNHNPTRARVKKVVIHSNHGRTAHFYLKHATGTLCSAALTSKDIVWMEHASGLEAGALFKAFKQETSACAPSVPPPVEGGRLVTPRLACLATSARPTGLLYAHEIRARAALLKGVGGVTVPARQTHELSPTGIGAVLGTDGTVEPAATRGAARAARLEVHRPPRQPPPQRPSHQCLGLARQWGAPATPCPMPMHCSVPCLCSLALLPLSCGPRHCTSFQPFPPPTPLYLSPAAGLRTTTTFARTAARKPHPIQYTCRARSATRYSASTCTPGGAATRPGLSTRSPQSAGVPLLIGPNSAPPNPCT